MKLAEIFMDPKADIFQEDSSPRPSSAMSKHAKTLSLETL